MKQNRKTVLVIVMTLALFTGVNKRSSAQFVVTDPSNLVQSIVNTAREVIQTSATASNMINNFKETVKIYEQGKKYYDALKSVHNLVKDARKVQETILMIGEISDIYVTSYQLILQDENYTADELGAIAYGYIMLLEESSNLLLDLQEVTNINGLSMSDKERMEIIDSVHGSVKNYRNLVRYYTNRTIVTSYLRSKRKGDIERVVALYSTNGDRYW